MGDKEKFPQALGFESLDPFFTVSKRFIAAEADGGYNTNLNLIAKLMVLHGQILVSVAIASIAEAILMRISVKQLSSLQRLAPRDLKLVTYSTFWPFMLISALGLFVLLVMILLFSVLTSIPYAVALCTSLLVRS